MDGYFPADGPPPVQPRDPTYKIRPLLSRSLVTEASPIPRQDAHSGNTTKAAQKTKMMIKVSLLMLNTRLSADVLSAHSHNE